MTIETQSNPQPPIDLTGSKPDRVAVVVVHGMGEQMPMDTLRDFVDAVWATDTDLHADMSDGSKPSNPAEVFDKPDLRTGTRELRRLSTRSSRAANRPGTLAPAGDRAKFKVDFFEFYWADAMRTNTWGDFLSWFSRLLLRKPKNVPKTVMPIWLFLWCVTAVLIVAGVWAATLPVGQASLLALALAGVMSGIKWFATVYFGDAARYTMASPGNIVPRREIRDRGLGLLATLSKDERYERIVVVAHSLGGIVAYDLIAHLWADYANEAINPAAKAAAAKLVAATKDMPRDVFAYRKAQRTLFYSLNQRPAFVTLDLSPEKPTGIKSWRISDFVTIGCPLTHAEFLLAFNKEDLAKRFKRRELPTCPPAFDKINGAESIVFHDQTRNVDRFLHDAPFGPVRWTNIHDSPRKPRSFLIGDCLSGPVGPLFANRPLSSRTSKAEDNKEKKEILGPSGILDIRPGVDRIRSALPRRFFTHNSYWSIDKMPTASVNAIRAAINLLDEERAETELAQFPDGKR